MTTSIISRDANSGLLDSFAGRQGEIPGELKGAQDPSATPGNYYVKEAYRVRLVPDISAAAFKQSLVNQLAMWYCLRALDTNGQGRLRFEEVIVQLEQVFNFTRATAYRQLQAWQGGFWVIQSQNEHTTIHLKGIKAVWAYLGIPFATDRYFREVTPAEFATTRQRKAQIYASIYKPGDIKANPISRAAITEATGLHKVQQRRLEIEAKVKRVYNAGFDKINDEIKPIKQEIFTVAKGSREINKRLPNTYHSKQHPSNKGMLRHIAKGRKSLICGEASLVKRYFIRLSRLVRALTRKGNQTRYDLQEGYYRLKLRDRLIPGRQEWVRVVC